MEIIQCAICGKKQNVKLKYPSTLAKKEVDEKTFSARRLPETLHYQLNECQNCGLIFSSPVYDISRIIKLYKGSKFTYDTEASFVGVTYYSYLIKFVVNLPKSAKFLDIGCGNGFFLAELQKQGYKNTYGVEPSQEAISKAPKILKGKIKEDILRPRLFPKNSFDVITCFHTLDHIVNPNDFLKVVYDLLKKDGLAYIVVHNTQGLSVKLLGGYSPIFDVEHIYLFNPSNLSQVFKKNGFKVKEVFDFKNTYPFGYWFKALPIPGIKNILLKTLELTRLGNIPLTLSAGNIGIIANKPK